MNNMTRTLFATVIAATLVAAPASAQNWNSNNSSSHISTIYINQNTPATVTYYDNDPMASSRRLRTVQLNLTAGGEGRLRRALRDAAPRQAQWARVSTAEGQRFVLNLHPLNSTNTYTNRINHRR